MPATPITSQEQQVDYISALALHRKCVEQAGASAHDDYHRHEHRREFAHADAMHGEFRAHVNAYVVACHYLDGAAR